MRPKTRIFLASSSELKAERAAFEQRIYRFDKQWYDDGIFLHLEVWEDFIDAVSRTRLQDEYNRAIEAADLFVLLVHTKVGKYSAEELKTALARFDNTGKPLVYTYFKNPPGVGVPDPGPQYDTVRKLRRALDKRGHFITPYEHLAELLDHFSQQLHKLRDKGVIQPAEAAAAATSQATPAVVVKGSGAAAVGRGAQAAGAGGVAIGRDNHGTVSVGARTRVNTGGGAYFGGPVTVTHGDVVGGNKVVHAPPVPAAPPAATFAQASAQLAAALYCAIHRDDQPVLEDLLAALKELAASQPEPRSDAIMARLVEGLGDLARSQPALLAKLLARPELDAWRQLTRTGPLLAARNA